MNKLNDILQQIDKLTKALKELEDQQDQIGENWEVLAGPLIARLSALKDQLLTNVSVSVQYSSTGNEEKKPVELPSLEAVGSVIGDGRVEVGGDIIGGNKIINQIYEGEIVTEQQEREAFSLYLRRLMNICSILDLHGIDRQAIGFNHNAIGLNEIFIHLNVLERVAFGEDQLGNQYRVFLEQLAATSTEIIGEWEMVPMTATEYINAHKRVVLLGDLGSGKSTLINYLTLCFAGCVLEPEAGWLSKLRNSGWLGDALLPVRVILGDFASSSHFGPTARNLWTYIQDELGLLADASKPILRALRSGKAFVMFDGLDGLDTASRFTAVSAITDLSSTYQENHYLVSCRTLVYGKDESVRMSRFSSIKLAPLMQSQVDEFIDAWYHEARVRNWDIRKGAENELRLATRRPDLAPLAKNPLLLTQMVLLHSSYGRLPEDRVDLYDEVTKLLLSRWEGRAFSEQSLAQYLGLPNLKLSNLETALSEVAFRAYEAKGQAWLSKAEVIDTIQKYFDGDWGKAQKFSEYIEARAGLLIGRGDGTFSFPHSTFQEFLAAKYLSLQHNFSARSADLVRDDPHKWREVYSLAVRLSGADRGAMAINSLCYQDPPTEPYYLNSIEKVEWQTTLIAGEALLEIGLLEIKQRPERLAILNRIQRWLVALLKTGALSVSERVEAGNILARLCDPRKGVSTLELDLVLIPKGSVLVKPSRGIAGSVDRSLNDYEFDIPYDYWISQYPVTQAQYALFIIENPDYQIPQGVEGYSWDIATRALPQERSNHPVVLVSWHDAKTYCRWLQKKLEERGLLPDGCEVRLATDIEWEKATRGGLTFSDGTKNPMPDRLYPWGKSIEEDRANLPNAEPVLAETTPVGIFPRGASPYGLLDMAGNVMEWTQTSWGSYDVESPGFDLKYNPYDGREDEDTLGYRILRGGSWLFAEGEAQCSCRLDPTSRYADVGMRVVVAPKGTPRV